MDVQTEFGRFQAAVDQKRRYATVNGLAQTCAILRATYTLLDMCEEMK